MIEPLTKVLLALVLYTVEPVPVPAPHTPAPPVQATATAPRRFFFGLSLGRGYGDVVGSFEGSDSGGRDNTFSRLLPAGDFDLSPEIGWRFVPEGIASLALRLESISGYKCAGTTCPLPSGAVAGTLRIGYTVPGDRVVLGLLTSFGTYRYLWEISKGGCGPGDGSSCNESILVRGFFIGAFVRLKWDFGRFGVFAEFDLQRALGRTVTHGEPLVGGFVGF